MTDSDEQPETATGQAVDALIEAVRKDMGNASGLLRQASGLFMAVARKSRGVNGLSVSCNGWTDHLGTILAEIEKEVSDVERRYRGEVPPVPIHEHADHEHAAKVSAARKTSEPSEDRP